jgi:PPOX class probable F420-dependent enzyme
MSNQKIPDNMMDLFERKAFAHVATVMPDGSPQVTPVWIDYDGKYILFNTSRGRQKDRNLRRDPHVALSIMDPDNAYRYLGVRGRVVEETEDGADAHIDKLANKYTGAKYKGRKPGMVRVIYKVLPESVWTNG